MSGEEYENMCQRLNYEQRKLDDCEREIGILRGKIDTLDSALSRLDSELFRFCDIIYNAHERVESEQVWRGKKYETVLESLSKGGALYSAYDEYAENIEKIQGMIKDKIEQLYNDLENRKIDRMNINYACEELRNAIMEAD